MPRTKKQHKVTTNALVLGGFIMAEIPALPFCDCVPMGHGFVKREDGAWVRPCCMRRQYEAWAKWGDAPIPQPPIEDRLSRQALDWRKRIGRTGFSG